MENKKCLLGYAQNPKYDILIKAALLNADRKGQLAEVARVVGMTGGAEALRKVYTTPGELHLMDRAMIGMHIGNIDKLFKDSQ